MITSIQFFSSPTDGKWKDGYFGNRWFLKPNCLECVTCPHHVIVFHPFYLMGKSTRLCRRTWSKEVGKTTQRKTALLDTPLKGLPMKMKKVEDKRQCLDNRHPTRHANRTNLMTFFPCIYFLQATQELATMHIASNIYDPYLFMIKANGR